MVTQSGSRLFLRKVTALPIGQATQELSMPILQPLRLPEASAKTFNANGASVNPNGTVYFTLDSASGQKYYSLAPKQPYTAFMECSAL
ncbi:MAG: hypothetical protein ABSA75_14715 [Candidatus Bathyarchaeia archaeon]